MNVLTLKDIRGSDAKSYVANKTGASVMNALVAKPKAGKRTKLSRNKYLK